jgi:hypothetical protein
MGYLVFLILFTSLIHVFHVLLKVSKKEKEFVEWINK